MDDHQGTANDVTWYHSRNAAGELVSTTRTNDAYAWAGHYALSRPYATNGLNQYTAAGGATFAYDANGNLTGDGSNAFVYDVENRLVSASGAHHARLDYDPLGRLWQVTDTQSGAVTRFLYDGDALVAEYDGAGAMTRRYAHWAGADTPMAAFDGAGLSAMHHMFADHEGSIVALADGAGALVATNTYDEYGIPGAANQGRFQYTGQAWLAELGLYYYKARIYSPTLGRFLQTDPVGYADQFNLYAYVGDDPVDRTDPTGRSCSQDLRSGDYHCQIDRVDVPAGQTMTPGLEVKIQHFDREYTRAVNTLMHTDRYVTVAAMRGYPASRFTAYSRDIGSALIRRQFRYTVGSHEGNASMDTIGHPVRGVVTTRVFDSGINDTAADIIHEGIHGSLTEIRFNPYQPVLGNEPYQTLHQDPYNHAGADFLGEPR